MPADTFARRVDLSADADTCWVAITDIGKLMQWISIVNDAQEVEHLSRYTAMLTDRVGPFSLKAQLEIVVTEVEEGKLIALRAEGRDRQVDSRISVEGHLALTPRETGCRLEVEGRYEVTGKVATFGSAMIRSKANTIIGNFFAGIESELG
jgi:carbon monoxide dehydrogenase subunit G